MYAFELSTQRRTEFVEITDRVAEALRRSGLRDGAVLVYVPHTTAGCTINENADPDVVRDMLAHVARTIPFEGDYRHAEGNSAAHMKAAYFGTSQQIPVVDGRLALGQWQGVYFCEFDGPRRRRFIVQPLAGFAPERPSP